ncbi:hypothetical protein SAMN04488113_16011 [Alkalibacterium gilvum]|uniref:Uncharacterized protein n=1 Tax=Alkalibacterium gilvum TaxID=1130080 RepID=A0A1H6VZD6_9LACT|nr:hypothetical protein SAMN04488113_16011 [Alkalibacterium gilvum]
MILKNLLITIVYTIIFITISLWTGYNNEKMPFAIAIFLFIILSYIINISIDLIVSKIISKTG